MISLEARVGAKTCRVQCETQRNQVKIPIVEEYARKRNPKRQSMLEEQEPKENHVVDEAGTMLSPTRLKCTISTTAVEVEVASDAPGNE